MAKSIDRTVYFVERHIENLNDSYTEKYAKRCMERACACCIRGNYDLLCDSCPIKKAYFEAREYIQIHRTGVIEEFPVSAYA